VNDRHRVGELREDSRAPGKIPCLGMTGKTSHFRRPLALLLQAATQGPCWAVLPMTTVEVMPCVFGDVDFSTYVR
jgi:hypothetical protein